MNIEHFSKNEDGRDFVVGDIHGCFAKLDAKLLEIGFDESTDRLFSVGDLVDRGPESEKSLEWLAKPWFHAVMGNHEMMAIMCAEGQFDASNYAYNGGSWMLAKTQPERRQFADVFSCLPTAIEVETTDGMVGIIHAECPVAKWGDLDPALTGHNADAYLNCCLWSRERITNGMTKKVSGIRAVICGHTPIDKPITLGNVHYIDTGACFGNRELTVLALATLEAA